MTPTERKRLTSAIYAAIDATNWLERRISDCPRLIPPSEVGISYLAAVRAVDKAEQLAMESHTVDTVRILASVREYLNVEDTTGAKQALTRALSTVAPRQEW